MRTSPYYLNYKQAVMGKTRRKSGGKSEYQKAREERERIKMLKRLHKLSKKKNER